MKRKSLRTRAEPATSQLVGATVLGERGQVVVPKDIRDRLGLRPGAKMMVMQHGDSPVMLIPVERMQEMIRRMSERVDRVLAAPRKTRKN